MFTIVRRISTKLFSTFNVFVTYLGTLHYNEITPLRNIFGCAYRVVSAMRGVSENLAISEIVLYYKFCSNNIVVYVIPAFSCRLAIEYNYIPNEYLFSRPFAYLDGRYNFYYINFYTKHMIFQKCFCILCIF